MKTSNRNSARALLQSLILASLVMVGTAAQKPAIVKPEDKTEKRVKELISQMTLEEKAALCIGASPWTTTPIERLGVPELSVSDGPHGVRRVADVNDLVAKSLPATCFPTASCMALFHSAGTWASPSLTRGAIRRSGELMKL